MFFFIYKEKVLSKLAAIIDYWMQWRRHLLTITACSVAQISLTGENQEGNINLEIMRRGSWSWVLLSSLPQVGGNRHDQGSRSSQLNTTVLNIVETLLGCFVPFVQLEEKLPLEENHQSEPVLQQVLGLSALARLPVKASFLPDWLTGCLVLAWCLFAQCY